MQIPVGSIVSYIGTVDPPQQPDATWLLCDGRTLNRTQYAGLTALEPYPNPSQSTPQTYTLPTIAGSIIRVA